MQIKILNKITLFIILIIFTSCSSNKKIRGTGLFYRATHPLEYNYYHANVDKLEKKKVEFQKLFTESSEETVSDDILKIRHEYLRLTGDYIEYLDLIISTNKKRAYEDSLGIKILGFSTNTTGILMGVATTALTIANPSGNAVWIASLGAGSGVLFGVQKSFEKSVQDISGLIKYMNEMERLSNDVTTSVSKAHIELEESKESNEEWKVKLSDFKLKLNEFESTIRSSTMEMEVTKEDEILELLNKNLDKIESIEAEVMELKNKK